MKKFAVILVILSLTRIGVAYADTTNGADSQNYFFGTKSAAANLNQVLALLVGPKGDPGPAGVAGKDGLIGMDGKDGKDGKDGLNGLNGLDGAPGAVGQPGAAGAGVLAVAFTGVQGGCVSGGVKFTDAAGKNTYACNGTNGTDGGVGTQTTVTQVVTGPVSGYTYAQGAVLVGTCDSFVAIKPIRSFTRMGFGFAGFVIGDTGTVVNDSGTVLNGGISTTCDTNPVKIEFFTDSAYPDAPYTANDHIVCTSKQTAGNYGAVTGGQRAIRFNGGTYRVPSDSLRNGPQGLGSGDFECVADSAPNATFALVYLNTADYTDKIGFQIG